MPQGESAVSDELHSGTCYGAAGPELGGNGSTVFLNKAPLNRDTPKTRIMYFFPSSYPLLTNSLELSPPHFSENARKFQ